MKTLIDFLLFASLVSLSGCIVSADESDTVISISPTTELVVTEDGGTASFSVALNGDPPEEDISIELSCSDLTECSIDKTILVFSPGNWSIPQDVTITGVDDSIPDGNQKVSISTSLMSTNDPSYENQEIPDVSVVNIDNDSAGITILQTPIPFSENGGTTTFSVVLNSQPDGDVVLDVTSSDTSEADVDKPSLTFTELDWSTAQVVTVTGINDDLADGNQSFNITVAVNGLTTDITGYASLGPQNIPVTTQDDDTATITIDQGTVAPFSENGGTTTFSVVLNSPPDGDVVLDVTSSDTSEADVDKPSLTFTDLDWNIARVVTVTGINDDLADGNQFFNITVAVNGLTTDITGYASLGPQNIPVTTQDDDTATITIDQGTVAPFSENGGTTTFSVVLNSQPDGDVVLDVTSSDTSEADVDKPSLTFTELDWSTAQVVTVTGINDDMADGNQSFNITVVESGLTSDSTGYALLGQQNIPVTTQDDDVATITIDQSTVAPFSENGGTTTFSVVLNSQPDGDVVLDVTSSDTSEADVDKPSLTFTGLDWSTAQVVTVTGINDDMADGNQLLNITVVESGLTSDSTGYALLGQQNIPVTTRDDDVVAITIDQSTVAPFSENGGTTTFSVVLNSQPDGDVVLDVTSSDTSEADVDKPSLTFTDLDWSTAQVVTVTGINDNVVDGNQLLNISVAESGLTSDTTGYASLGPQSISVLKFDDDVTAISIGRREVAPIIENGGTMTFSVVLNSQPDGDVVLDVTSSDTSEADVDKPSLTFTGLDWSTAQVVTVTGINDTVADGNQSFNITVAESGLTTDTTGYASLGPQSISVTILDDDGIPVVGTHGSAGVLSGSQWVVCSSDPNTAWLSADSSGQYNALDACSSLGFSTVDGYGGTWGTVCGYRGTPGYMFFDGRGGTETDLGMSVHWFCSN